MTQIDLNSASIIVTFQPDEHALLRLITVLAHQVDKIYVVDNTPSGFCNRDFDFGHSHANLIQLGKNLGVAAAQNAGIHKAREEGSTHVLLMDQDSEPSENMVEILFAQLSELEKRGMKIAAVGPCLVNARNGRIRPFSINGSHHHESTASDRAEWVVCDYLLASGSLIPLRTLDAVGEMEEELFIDCVDIEWAHRAASMGFVCIGVLRARMHYTQGKAQWNVLGCSMVKYPPLRNYYFFRNIVELARRNYIHSRWKRHVLFRSPLYALLLSTLAPPRLANLNMVIRGIVHGIRHRLGPLR